MKSYSLTAAMNDLDPAIGPASAILPVINGMAHIEALSARFGANRILGGVAIISATLGQDGRIIQLLPVHELVFGDPEDDASDRGHAIADVLMGAGFDARQSEIIMQEMWEEWVRRWPRTLALRVSCEPPLGTSWPRHLGRRPFFSFSMNVVP